MVRTVAGVQDPITVDLVAVTAEGQVVLIMVEDRQWDGSNERVLELQTKISNYVSFALDGQMIRLYPEAEGRSLAIQLDCTSEPDDSIHRFLQQIEPRLAAHGIELKINLLRA